MIARAFTHGLAVAGLLAPELVKTRVSRWVAVSRTVPNRFGFCRPAAAKPPGAAPPALTSAVVRGTTFGLCAAVLALPLAACGGNSATAAPGPTTVQQVCDAQSWPRPVPQVAGAIFDDASTGALACWDNVKAIAPDGHDVANGPANDGAYRITSVSPAPGTPIGHSDVVTLHVVPVDVTASPAFHPCDWVTEDQAAKFLGVSSTSATPAGDESGSAEPFCSYRSDSHFVTSQLSLPASFPVDAQTELNMLVADHGSEVTGLPGGAYCATRQSDGKTSTTLQVILGGNRLYQALGWHGESCDTLKQFAQTAIPRIGS